MNYKYKISQENGSDPSIEEIEGDKWIFISSLKSILESDRDRCFDKDTFDTMLKMKEWLQENHPELML